jgi:hypothetical protein
MKTKVRNENAITSAMGWLDQLREDGHAEPVSGSDSEPAVANVPATCPPVDASARPPNAANRRHETRESVEIIEPAPIGDALRIPIAWCEMGSCISHYEHPAALGEADIRARAIEAGWRVDALGRLACPQCQRSGPWFWTIHPVVPWDRHRAVAAVAAMTTAAGEDVTGGARRGAGRDVIQAAAPPLVPLPAQGRHRESLGDCGRAG